MTMRKSTNLWYLLAYLFFLVGAVLAYVENGSELAFWIMSMGIAIDLTLLILPVFGASKLKINLRRGSPSLRRAFACHILAILLALGSIPVRFLSYNLFFHLLLAVAILLWSLSMLAFGKHIHK
jgi:hypothetical protein